MRGVATLSGNSLNMLICHRSTHFGTLALIAMMGFACSGNSGSAGQNTDLGGGSPTGGSVANSGGSSALASGGAATGGTASSVVATGGVMATGGATSTRTSTGGANPTGGATSTGGVPSSGGATGGGATPTGGANPSGGATSTGGASTNPGGATSTGGLSSTATGGTSSAGGATSNGGLPALHVEQNLLKDANGKTIVLRGVSLIDIGNLYYAAQQNASGITARIDKILAAGLQPHVIRLPVYPRTCVNGNYPAYSQAPFPLGPAAPSGIHIALTQDDYLNKVLKPAVDYVQQKGMYAIIDFHQIDNATTGTSGADATTFWQYMAAKFASYTNVIYEAFNEPIDSAVSWANFKPVAQGWVDTIRSAAPNNIIIVPSMIYDQKPGDAADSPLTGNNLMYTAHIYPGNWSTAFKAQVANAVTKVPVFMTEWGYMLNSTDKTLGTSSATWGSDFRTLVDGNGASWTAWVTDNSWQPNMFTTTALTTLTDFGTLTKTWLADTYGSDWVQ